MRYDNMACILVFYGIICVLLSGLISEKRYIDIYSMKSWNQKLIQSSDQNAGSAFDFETISEISLEFDIEC